jgi:hypothetical protein
LTYKTCMHCGSNAMRRINRRGFLEETLLPRFGLFPWECAMCRRKTFLRDNGHSEIRRKAHDRRDHEHEQNQSAAD